ncbi:hypothetical protein [Fibrobacter sp. UWR1]|nr:hypothetical protein [Fibrobacter sp. UWR1]PWJ59139.1 hypothetical protein BGX12_14321 [Fibrobacter sp. UWR4]PZW63433.1 hypothetical protein C8E88_10451 [Fibrobacter sp. UWR1]
MKLVNKIVLAILFLLSVNVFAEVEGIPYINSSGKLAGRGDNPTTVLTSDMTTWENDSEKPTEVHWYIASEDIELSERIVVNRRVYLILADGATLTASKGITVSEGADFRGIINMCGSI